MPVVAFSIDDEGVAYGSPSCRVYLQGCDLRCRFCNMRDVVTGRSGHDRIEDAIRLIEERLVPVVVVTGGEPLVSPNIMIILRKLNRLRRHLHLETSGNHPSRLRSVLDTGVVDSVQLDLKAVSNEMIRSVTQSTLTFETFLLSQQVLIQFDIPYEIGVTLWHQYSPRDVVRLREAAGDVPIRLKKMQVDTNMVDPAFVTTLAPVDADEQIALFESHFTHVLSSGIRPMPTFSKDFSSLL